MISNGSGKVTGSFTQNNDGVVCQYTLTGSYTVNPNGTGTIDVTQASSTECGTTTAEEISVLFDGGDGVAFLNAGGVILGSLTKQ